MGAFVPPADLLIDDDGVIVYMDVPGMRVEDIQIEVRADADRAEKQAGATA